MPQICSQIGVPQIGSKKAPKWCTPDWLPDRVPQIVSHIWVPQIVSEMGFPRLAPRLFCRWGIPDWLPDVVPQIGSKMGMPQISSQMEFPRLISKWVSSDLGPNLENHHFAANLWLPILEPI